jgi:hypothetical protein
MEFLRAADCILSDHGIGHQKHFAGPQLRSQLTHLLHQPFIDVQAAGGVHDQDVMATIGSVLAGGQGQIDRRGNSGAREARHFDGLGDDGQLLPCRRTIDVR